jgi:predicted permease
MVGDLLEEWSRRAPGPRRAAWFAGVTLRLGARYAAVRAARAVEATGTAAVASMRGALRHPLQTAFTVVALGVGVAAPATMYSVVAGITRNVDVDGADRLVHFGRRFNPTDVGIAPLDWLWPAVDGMDGLEAAGVYDFEWVDLSDEEHPAERVAATLVSPGVFRAFGVDPALGRTFTEEDARLGPAPVVLGWGLWTRRFGGDRSVLGRSVRLDGEPRTVVGVMPEGYQYPTGAEVWAPMDPADSAAAATASHQAVGRLAPGVPLERIQAQVAVLNESLRERGEDLGPGGGVAAELWRDGLIAPEARRMLGVMLVVVGFVLVIACADVLNLLLARALHRSRETAVRVALGAGRGRIVAEHLTEAAVLSALAGAVALGLTVLAVRVFEVETAGLLAHWMDVRVDIAVLAFGAGMVALAAAGTGIVPAVQSGRLHPGPALRDGGRGASAFRIGRLSRWLVVGEIALSGALLVMSGLMVRGAVSSLRTDGTYATGSVLTARYELRPDAYADEEVPAFHRRLVDALRGRPGVADVAVASYLPGIYSLPVRVALPGSEEDPVRDLPRSHAAVVSPGFFGSLESDLARGRDFAWNDGAGGELPVIVNEAFVRRHLADRDPLGARLRVVSGGEPEDFPWATVVGVAPQLGIGVGRDADATGVYLPASAPATPAVSSARRMAVVLRAAPGTDPRALLPGLRETMTGLDPDVALYEVGTLAEHIRATRAVESVFAGLFLTFGFAGLLLAGVGLYGVMAFGVHRRVRELGIRVALGAEPRRVLRTAVGNGLVQLGLGLAAGLGIAALVAPHLGLLLLGADPRDPAVYGAVIVVLGLTGLTAAVAPARRALGVDVVEALRTE